METHKANCPCCDKSFSGKTAQRRLNSHCKNNHISYYRQHIRPLKNTKAVNHDAYIRRRDKDPAKVRQARLMSQLKKRARLEQINSIKQSPRVEEPMLPKEITINPSNPFYVVEFELKIFIGLKRDDLLAFDPIPVLEDAIQGVNPDLHEVNGRLLDALETARQAANEGVLPSLAHTYQFYRHAIQEGDLYEQRMQQFTFQQQKIMNPEKYIDEDLVAKRAAELLAEYKPRKYRRTKTAPTTGGAEDTEGTDGDSELEEDLGMDNLTYAFVEPSRGLTDEIPNSDRESSIEL